MTTVNGAAQTNTQTTKTTADRGKLSETYDNFLKLLTTQLQNQDPLSPMDSAQFTNQLVLYSQVEQQIGQNEKLEKLINMQNVSQTQASLGFIGMDVEASGNEVSYDGKPVKFEYVLPESATQAKIQILDASGRTVQVVDAKKVPGTHEFTWDGKNKNGLEVEKGPYTMHVVAVDGANEPIKATTTVFGRISGIETNEKGETLLMMGSVRLGIEQIRSAVKPTA
ncbi:flagellar hook assembly protein FlgD [Arenibaculum pallidiluteum]|uniref:flagellar hook assembly protein FlgD n=1 Tax=Arenibaculum pallidiluteum TaxID=2812559 RepID=UPI001A966E60|nr:flagellar hook assembly protein FlgD [Arenibaculum pallidiluteum]